MNHYGDDDKYIKTRIKTYKDSVITNFYNENGSKEIPEEKVPNYNSRFCYLCIWNVPSTKMFRRTQIYERKYKKLELYWYGLRIRIW